MLDKHLRFPAFATGGGGILCILYTYICSIYLIPHRKLQQVLSVTDHSSMRSQVKLKKETSENSIWSEKMFLCKNNVKIQRYYPARIFTTYRKPRSFIADCLFIYWLNISINFGIIWIRHSVQGENIKGLTRLQSTPDNRGHYSNDCSTACISCRKGWTNNLTT